MNSECSDLVTYMVACAVLHLCLRSSCIHCINADRNMMTFLHVHWNVSIVILNFYFIIEWYSIRTCVQHSRDSNNPKTFVSSCALGLSLPPTNKVCEANSLLDCVRKKFIFVSYRINVDFAVLRWYMILVFFLIYWHSWQFSGRLS